MKASVKSRITARQAEADQAIRAKIEPVTSPH
jgi:hypothetical protein